MIIRRNQRFGSTGSLPTQSGMTGGPTDGGVGSAKREGPEEEEDPIASTGASLFISLLGLPEGLEHVIESIKTAKEVGFGGFENALTAGAGALERLGEAINYNPKQILQPNLSYLPAPMSLNRFRSQSGIRPSTGMGSSQMPGLSESELDARRKRKIGA